MALMRISREAVEPDCIIKVLVVEFVCTFLFVFVGVASAMTAGLLSSDPLLGLFLMGTAQAFAVAVMMSTGFSISGGHLNPAVTLGLAVGGHITVFRSILYWIDQCVASAAACFLLQYLTSGLVEIPVYTLAVGMSSRQGILMEAVLAFSLLFTVYTTIVDPKKGSLDGLGPLLTGLVVGANIFAGGIFSGASMNPARSFGPALVSGFWTDHWVYWVGPFVGGGLAGLIYNKFFITRSHVVLPREDEARSVLAAATLT